MAQWRRGSRKQHRSDLVAPQAFDSGKVATRYSLQRMRGWGIAMRFMLVAVFMLSASHVGAQEGQGVPNKPPSVEGDGPEEIDQAAGSPTVFRFRSSFSNPQIRPITPASAKRNRINMRTPTWRPSGRPQMPPIEAPMLRNG